jgi:hypothetical protein
MCTTSLREHDHQQDQHQETKKVQEHQTGVLMRESPPEDQETGAHDNVYGESCDRDTRQAMPAVCLHVIRATHATIVECTDRAMRLAVARPPSTAARW